MECKVGDLAVVIRAQCKSNLGRIVLIVAADDGTDFVSFKNEGPVWRVKSERPQTWYLDGKRYRRKIGPVPENRLQPIRGLSLEGQKALASPSVLKDAEKLEEAYPMSAAVQQLEDELEATYKRLGLK
jgi:hypothetical protein